MRPKNESREILLYWFPKGAWTVGIANNWHIHGSYQRTQTKSSWGGCHHIYQQVLVETVLFCHRYSPLSSFREKTTWGPGIGKSGILRKKSVYPHNKRNRFPNSMLHHYFVGETFSFNKSQKRSQLKWSKRLHSLIWTKSAATKTSWHFSTERTVLLPGQDFNNLSYIVLMRIGDPVLLVVALLFSSIVVKGLTNCLNKSYFVRTYKVDSFVLFLLL